MARRRKPRVHVSEEQLNQVRKKIKSTPKRGRWPKYDQIHPCDLNDYIECFQFPEKVFLHPKYGNACFVRTCHRGADQVYDPDFDVVLPDEYKIVGTIRFYCESWDPDGAAGLYDLTCLMRCERISCPYYRKGFITETLKNRTFEEDITIELNNRHNKKQEID